MQPEMVPDELLGKVCPGVGVGVLIRHPVQRSHGRPVFLIGRRAPGVRNESGRWDIPGGGVEFGQPLVEVVVREVMEECAIQLRGIEQLGAIDHFVLDDDGLTQQHWVSVTYTAEMIPGQKPHIMEPHKCSDMRWLSLRQMRELELTSTMAANFALIARVRPDFL